MKDKKTNPLKRFAHNVKKGGKRMKKGLIAAGAAAVAGVIGVVALAVVGAHEPDDEEYIDVDYETIDEDDDIEETEANDEEKTEE